MTSIDKLDFILKAMEPYDGHYMNLTEITKQSEIIGTININELPGIVNKLYKDGYLDLETIQTKDVIFESDKKYMITFEGKLLNESRGYKYKEKQKVIATNLQLIQTWAIAVGTALAGLYALYQIIAVLRTSCH